MKEGPGKSHGKGISLLDVAAMFPGWAVGHSVLYESGMERRAVLSQVW